MPWTRSADCAVRGGEAVLNKGKLGIKSNKQSRVHVPNSNRRFFGVFHKGAGGTHVYLGKRG